MKIHFENIKIIIFIILLCLPLFSDEKNKTTPGQSDVTASKDAIYVIGHIHMDMNRLWTYSETMQMCNGNLEQTVAVMKEFSDYTVLQ